MRCIYCNSDKDLTVSDIIPSALTGAKLRKRFVCRTHNSFTNDHYEKTMIRQLGIFRNRIGLTERDGNPVHFFANLSIGEYTSEKPISISDNKSVMDTDRLFRMTNEQGNTVLVGPKDKLLKISGATEARITDLPLADISVSSRADIRELFISDTVLHVVAKVAYEWHCYVNDVEEFREDTYSVITSYILEPNQQNTLVSVVCDDYVMMLSDNFSRTGSNMLFEYNDSDGSVYVIFSLWNVIAYKVKVCRHNKGKKLIHFPTAYFYYSDGSQKGTLFGVYGDFHVNAMQPNVGITELNFEIQSRLSKLGERDLSREYLQNIISEISTRLSAYTERKISIAELLDFEHEDRIIPVFILEQLYIHRDEYVLSEDFYQNVRRILRTDDRFVLTEETKKETLERYLSMDRTGDFVTLLHEVIDFFKTICGGRLKS